MIIEVESACGDTRLAGKALSLDVLKSAVKGILQQQSEKDFVQAFCARFGYRELPCWEGYAAYIIDLDTHLVLVTSYTFPNELSGAKVLYYTDRGNFDPVYTAGGAVASPVSYLAICEYAGDTDCYLFHCDASLTVVADDCFSSMEACREYAAKYHTVWHHNKERRASV